MQYSSTIVSHDAADFSLTCKAHQVCLRCDRYVSAGLPVGVVHQHKRSTTITGGPLCKGCATKFMRWLNESNK